MKPRKIPSNPAQAYKITTNIRATGIVVCTPENFDEAVEDLVNSGDIEVTEIWGTDWSLVDLGGEMH